MDWNYQGFGGTITFSDGRTVWLQGDEAAELDDRIEACENESQIEAILSAYEHIAK